mgnify:CR=1 FL=1
MPEMDGFSVLKRLPEKNRPFIIFETADNESAIKAFELAVSFDADFAEALNSLANVFKKLKKRSKALLYYENAAAIKPDLDFIFGDICTAVVIEKNSKSKNKFKILATKL